MKHPKRVIVLSFDAMGAKDLSYMRTLPNFKAFLEGAAICENVKSVYPSITYPAHTSIVTGRWPKNHGIVNNTRIQPKRPTPDWFWQRKYIKGTTLYDEAIKKGFRTAALLWPVTAKSGIKWNIPEVLANRPWQTQVSASLANSSKLYLLDMNKRYGKLRDGVRQPALDNFVHACALDTIRRKDPDLFLIHLTDLDTNRHIYGVDHEKCTQAMQRHDRRLGEILAAVREASQKPGAVSWEETAVVILGDHYQKDTGQVVYPNYFLKEAGYLQTRGEKITAYQALAKNCDGCCYIYLKNSADAVGELGAKVRRLFEDLAKQPENGIARIFSGEEAAAMGADGECFLLLEAAEGFYFLDEAEVPARPVKEEKKHKMRGTHGYLPDKEGYATFFAMKGCGVQPGARVETMTLCDEGPTLARLLDVDLGRTDGSAVEELLEG